MTEILMLTKRIGNLFHEIMDISMQLADAIDRRDEVSMEMVIAMRSEPIGRLEIADRSLRELLSELDSGDEAAHIRAILNGDVVQPADQQEEILREQASMNIRAHRRLMELDEILNRKIARDKSIYNND